MASQEEPRSLPNSITVEWRVDDIRDRAEVLDVELSLDEQRQSLLRISATPVPTSAPAGT